MSDFGGRSGNLVLDQSTTGFDPTRTSRLLGGYIVLEPDPKDRCVLAEPMIHCADWERRGEERCGPTSIGECIAATFKVRQCAVQFRMSFDTLRLLSGGRQRQRLELGKASYFRMARLGPADARST